MMEEYTIPLSAYLRDRKVDLLTIHDIMHQLTVYCKKYVYDNTLPLETNRINAAEHFDSIIQSYNIEEVLENVHLNKILALGKGRVMLYYKSDMEDEIRRFGTILWQSSVFKDEMRVCLYEINVPDVRTRVLNSFRIHFQRELTEDELSIIMRKFDEWVELGYMTSDYRTDFNKYRKTFCRAIFTLLSRLSMNPEIITPSKFKEFSSTLFLIRFEKKFQTLDTAWNTAREKLDL